LAFVENTISPRIPVRWLSVYLWKQFGPASPMAISLPLYHRFREDMNKDYLPSRWALISPVRTALTVLQESISLATPTGLQVPSVARFTARMISVLSEAASTRTPSIWSTLQDVVSTFTQISGVIERDWAPSHLATITNDNQIGGSLVQKSAFWHLIGPRSPC